METLQQLLPIMKSLSLFRAETSEADIFRFFDMIKEGEEKKSFLDSWRGDMDEITTFVYYIFLRDVYIDLCDDRQNLYDDMFYFQINEMFDDYEKTARKYFAVCKKIANYHKVLSNYFNERQLIY